MYIMLIDTRQRPDHSAASRVETTYCTTILRLYSIGYSTL